MNNFNIRKSIRFSFFFLNSIKKYKEKNFPILHYSIVFYTLNLCNKNKNNNNKEKYFVHIEDNIHSMKKPNPVPIQWLVYNFTLGSSDRCHLYLFFSDDVLEDNIKKLFTCSYILYHVKKGVAGGWVE